MYKGCVVGGPFDNRVAGFGVVMGVSPEQMGHPKCQQAISRSGMEWPTGRSSVVECGGKSAEGDMQHVTSRHGD